MFHLVDGTKGLILHSFSVTYYFILESCGAKLSIIVCYFHCRSSENTMFIPLFTVSKKKKLLFFLVVFCFWLTLTLLYFQILRRGQRQISHKMVSTFGSSTWLWVSSHLGKGASAPHILVHTYWKELKDEEFTDYYSLIGVQEITV